MLIRARMLYMFGCLLEILLTTVYSQLWSFAKRSSTVWTCSATFTQCCRDPTFIYMYTCGLLAKAFEKWENIHNKKTRCPPFFPPTDWLPFSAKPTVASISKLCSLFATLTHDPADSNVANLEFAIFILFFRIFYLDFIFENLFLYMCFF